MNRCSFKYAMYFMQFRLLQGKTSQYWLMQQFEVRRNWLIKAVKIGSKIENEGYPEGLIVPSRRETDIKPKKEENATDEPLAAMPVQIYDLTSKICSEFRQKIDRENDVHSFEDLGLFDPFGGKKSILLAEKTVQEFELYRDLYPENVTSLMQKRFEESTENFNEPCKLIF